MKHNKGKQITVNHTRLASGHQVCVLVRLHNDQVLANPVGTAEQKAHMQLHTICSPTAKRYQPTAKGSPDAAGVIIVPVVIP
mgnify:CR=1 FL=1